MLKIALGVVLGAGVVSVLTHQNPIVSAPDPQPTGREHVWIFRNESDHAVARLLVDSQGVHDGAAPDGYAEVLARAQDEIRDAEGRVLSSSNVSGGLRVMSHSFKFDRDPRQGHCDGTQCPDMMEVHSSRHLRLTSDAGHTVDVVTGNQQRLIVSGDGTIRWPNVTAPPHETRRLCVDDAGRMMTC